MKKILRKLGVLGLIVGVLTPFITVPKVNAETNDGCTYHLNQYLFMDVSFPEAFETYTESTGYKTYTSFLLDFPYDETKEIKIESVGEIALDDDTALENFFTLAEKMDSNKSYISDTHGKYNKTAEVGNYIENTFVGSKHDSVTSYVHGFWANEEGNGEPQLGGWNIEGDYNAWKKNTFQGIQIDAKKRNEDADLGLTVDFNAASFDGTQYGHVQGYGKDNLLNFFNDVYTDVENAKNEEIVHYYFKAKSDYFNISINRSFDVDNLDEFNFGYCDDDKCYVFTMDSSKDKVTESYTAYVNYKSAGNLCDESSADNKCYIKEISTKKKNSEIDFDVNNWNIYWPVILGVEYSLCPKTVENPDDPLNPLPIDETWKVVYNKNTNDDVANMPSEQTAKVKESITVSDKKPTRSGWTFKQWCTGKNGDGDCYNPKGEIKNTGTAKVELFAHWVQEGTSDNPKQGVISYVLGFAAVGLVAGGIYLVSKKKNLFKQI